VASIGIAEYGLVTGAAMDDADIFHEATADEGGRLDTATLDPATAKGLNQVAIRARGFLRTAATALPNMPPIHFDFIDNWKFNAVAFKCKGGYFIGLYRGATATLAMLFDRMLADSLVLPFIGDVSEETADLPLIPNVGPDFERSVASVPTFPRPRNPARRSTAHKLLELALDFLTAHEFAHIANGHIDYLENSQGIRTIKEVDRATRSSNLWNSALINQTMEMDADGTAVLICLGSEWGKIVGAFPRPGSEWDYIYDRPGMVSLLWSWAVSSLFRTFGEARLADEDITQESHPSSRLRSVMIQQAAGRVPRPKELRTHSTLIGDEFYKIPLSIQAAHRDVEKMFSQVTGKQEVTEGLDDAWGDRGKSQMHRLQDYWRTTLKGELLRSTYQPLSDYGDTGEEVTEEGS